VLGMQLPDIPHVRFLQFLPIFLTKLRSIRRPQEQYEEVLPG